MSRQSDGEEEQRKKKRCLKSESDTERRRQQTNAKNNFTTFKSDGRNRSELYRRSRWKRFTAH